MDVEGEPEVCALKINSLVKVDFEYIFFRDEGKPHFYCINGNTREYGQTLKQNWRPYKHGTGAWFRLEPATTQNRRTRIPS